MRRIFSFIFLFIIIFFTDNLYAQKIIKEIKFIRNDVFDKKDKKVFQTLNKLHITTKISTIKLDLLFKKGDILDEKLLRNSERKLL
jgi:hypothetical protein